MNKVLLFLVSLIFFGCKKPIGPEAEKSKFNKIDDKYLKECNAENPKFSLLIFGNGYFDSDLIVVNCQKLKPVDSTKTLKLGPFAKVYRIDNTCTTNVQDLKRQRLIEFVNDSIKKHKFIYVEREFETDSLIIHFEDNHLPIK